VELREELRKRESVEKYNDFCTKVDKFEERMKREYKYGEVKGKGILM